MRNVLLAACLLVCLPATAELPKKEFDGLHRKAKKALKLGDMTAVKDAVGSLAADDSARAVDAFLNLAKVPDQSVYEALRKGLAGMSSEGAQQAMLEVASKKGGSSMGKLLLIDAMELRKGAFAGELLAASLADKRPEVQRAAIVVIGKVKARPAAGKMIELLVLLEKKEGGGLNANLIRQTLTELTGESFATAEDWSKYWESNADAAPQRPKTGGAGNPKETKRRKVPKFFGSEILSQRVVFVIDTSLSMDEGAMQRTGGRVYPEGSGPKRQPAAAGTRIARAKAQLKEVVQALTKDTRFGMISYSAPKPGPAKLVPGKPIPETINKFTWLKRWKPKLTPANKKAKANAARWIDALYADGVTYTLRALEAALRMPDVDLIVLLSDGEPNDIDLASGQKLNFEQILAEVKKVNRTRRCVIDTFGILTERPGAAKGMTNLEKFLRDLAEQNGGKFTKVPQK